MSRQERILEYWFEGVEASEILSKEAVYSKRWFSTDSNIKKAIKTEFEGDIKEAGLSKYDSWKKSTEGSLALVLLLDIFPRIIYPGELKAFSYDLKALECTLKALKQKQDDDLELIQRVFFYYPLMHSENVELQEMSIMYYKRIFKYAQDEEPQNEAYYKDILDFAKTHYGIIKHFGRFPHRNILLGRRPTTEERQFASGPEAVF